MIRVLDGINLTLMAGVGVARPVPSDVLNALQSAEVTISSGSRSPSGFRLRFSLSNRSPLQTFFLLAGGSLPPVLRVILAVTMNGSPQVLIDGVVTNHDVSPDASGFSTVMVTGVDLTAIMDLISFTGLPYPAMPAEARVLLVLAKYAALGIVPRVVPAILSEVPNPIDRIPIHQGSDWQYLLKLADDNGYVFYMDPGSKPGQSVAYWGPEIKIGSPQRALNVNMDAETNVESLEMSFDTESRTLPVLFIQDLITKAPIPIPVMDITPLSPPLAALPAIPKRIEKITGTSKMSPGQAALVGIAKAASSANAVSINGSLDAVRYGRLLQARRLVGLRGVGTAFDGLYYVRSVTHKIKRGEYKQSFKLVRNGLVSTVAEVPA